MLRKRRRIYLREWRLYRDRTQAQVAEALGVTKTHISNIENAKRQYTQELLEAAADYLICEPWHILNVDPNHPDAKWSIWESVSKLPANKMGDAKRIIGALAEPADDAFRTDAPTAPTRRRRKA